MSGGWELPAHRVAVGAGALGEVPDTLRRLGVRSVALVTTPGRLADPVGERLRAALGRRLVATVERAGPQVSGPALQAALGELTGVDVDGLVSLGGGATVDLAKAVAWFTEQSAGTPGAAWTDRPALVHVAVPTTLSVAAHTPRFAVADPRTGRFRPASAPTVRPVAVHLDPVGLADTDPTVLVASGLDTVARCVDALCSPGRNPLAETTGAAALRALGAVLGAVGDGDADGLGFAAVAACLAGEAVGSVPAGPAGVVADAVGLAAGCPTGHGAAVTLPRVTAFLAGREPDGARRVGEALGDPDDPAGAVERLIATVGAPRSPDDLPRRIDPPAVAAAVVAAHPDLGLTDADVALLLEAL